MQLPHQLRLVTATEVGVGNFVPLVHAHQGGAFIGDLRVRSLTNTPQEGVREAILHSSARSDWPDPRPHHFVVWADVKVRGRGPGALPLVTIHRLVAGMVPKDLHGVDGMFVLDITGATYSFGGPARMIPGFPTDWHSALNLAVTNKVADFARTA